MQLYRKHNISAEVVFSTCKIKSYFSLKCKVDRLMRSCVVYQYTCPVEPSTQYIGKTKRRFHQRIDEHYNSDTAINEHIHRCECCKSSYVQNFEIVYKARSDFELSVVESLKIRREQPELNKKDKRGSFSFLLRIFDSG